MNILQMPGWYWTMYRGQSSSKSMSGLSFKKVPSDGDEQGWYVQKFLLYNLSTWSNFEMRISFIF